MDSREQRAAVDDYREILRLGHRYETGASEDGANDTASVGSSGSYPNSGGADDSGPDRRVDGTPRWRAKRDSHDDGELSGLFLGGIGAPTMARDVDGRFRRWHLQPGYHVVQAIDAAFLSLRWNEGASNGSSEGRSHRIVERGYTRLAAAGPHAFDAGIRSVYSLFPVTHEHYRGDRIPWEASLELYSPLLIEEVSTWPVWIAAITVTNRSDRPIAVDTALFWPNLLGWRAPRTTAVDRPERPWPGQTHAGNTARLIADLPRFDIAAGPDRSPDRDVSPEHDDSPGVGAAADLHGVLQQRNPDQPVRTEMEGEVALLSIGDSGDRRSVEACFKTGINKIDRPPEEQGHTLPWVEERFRQTGSLPQTNRTWTAHWDESIGSALHRGFDLAPGESRRVEYIVAFDIPLVQFGSDRHWYRKYTARFGTDGRNAVSIAVAAAGKSTEWREEIDRLQHGICGSRGNAPLPEGETSPDGETSPEGSAPGGTAATPGGTGLPVAADHTGAAAMLNELYFVNGGGTVWVDRWADELDDHLPAPVLGSGEHAAILEGYDVGYYYYNTTDLWPYGWYAIYRWWPSFARNVFDDLLKTIPLELPEDRVYYRTETVAPLLVRGKLPHDVGSPMGDPWHRINGYQMRDDSNLWKDHNPAFILSYYLFARLDAREITATEWKTLKEAGQFFLDQDTDGDGLPRHDEFGDSTWDNLGVEGLASYSGSVSLAALAALASWAAEFGDTPFEAECTGRLHRGVVAYRDALWCDDGYFRLCDTGKYRDALMADAMIGFFLADLAGLGPRVIDRLPGGVTRAQIRSHMERVLRYNVDQYAAAERVVAAEKGAPPAGGSHPGAGSPLSASDAAPPSLQGTTDAAPSSSQGATDTATWLTTGRGAPLLVAAPGTTRYQGDGGDELQVNEVLVGSAWMTVAILEHVGLTDEARGIARTLDAAIYGTEEPTGPRSGAPVPHPRRDRRTVQFQSADEHETPCGLVSRTGPIDFHTTTGERQMTTTPAERTKETAEKLTRLRTWMEQERLTVMILRRTPSVAWITAGATDYVNTATSEGPITAIITADRAVAVANNIEAPRFRDEEHLDRTGWEIVEVPWYDASRAPTPAAITGIGITPETAGSDVPYPGTRNVGGEISRLRSRLLPVEQARFRDLAAECAAVMSDAVALTKPGQSEFEIAGHLAAASQPRGIQSIVNLVATDERMHRYRHPLPTEKKLERHALLVLCGRRDGLVASISRIVHFGPVPEEIQRTHEAVAGIDAAVISASRPGRTLGEIFTEIQNAYDAAGFPGGWNGHHQGGVAAYEPREYLALPGSTDRLEAGMVCAWNPSLPGAKSEDSIIVGADGPDVVTPIDGWPMVQTATIPRPGILVR